MCDCGEGEGDREYKSEEAFERKETKKSEKDNQRLAQKFAEREWCQRERAVLEEREKMGEKETESLITLEVVGEKIKIG